MVDYAKDDFQLFEIIPYSRVTRCYKCILMSTGLKLGAFLVAPDQGLDVFAVISEAAAIDLSLDPVILLIRYGDRFSCGSQVSLHSA